MPSRFSSNYDYSQTFQFLVENNEASLESKARALDAEREAELAARDSLMFTKWQEGKISGNELMAHINRRMRQTGYDKAQQAKWKEAAIEYGNVIADEKAEAAYAETQNISALIAHYTKRLAGTKAGTPERREIAERLNALRERRDTDRVRRQARRIQRAIDRGEMSTKDMIDFYKEQLGTVSDPDLRADIKDNIAKLQGQLRQERFETAMTQIDTKLASGRISPQAAANEKAAILNKFGIQDQDPVAFAQWQQQLQQLRATPDPAQVEALEAALLAGDISPEEYSARIRQFADEIAPFDLTASWELKQEALNYIKEYATPLAEGSLLSQASGNKSDGTYSGTIEVVRKLRGNAIKHITQFDGGKYNGTNCGMAAGAMVAHMMGYTGITGSDLRSLSGDTEGGTNVWQAMGAMTSKQIGIPANQLDARSNWSFDEFKQRVANGAPAVLSGWTGDLPPQLNSTSGVMGHGVAIAGYDAKRDAFLVLDPSGRGNQAKAWWPAEVVKAFAWGGQGGFNGIAMLGPTGTIDPKTLNRVGGKIRHINVTAPPERFPDAPRIESPMDPGPAVKAQKANDALTKLQRQRLKDAGIIPGKDLDTQQEVSQLLLERDEDIADIRAVVDEWVELSQQPGMYDEDTNSVTLVTSGLTLSGEDIADLQKQLLYLYDGQQILYRANGEPEKARKMQDAKNAVVTEAAIVNTIEADFAANRVQREIADTFTELYQSSNPMERREMAERALDQIESITAIYEAQDEGEEGTATEDKTDVQRQADRIDEVNVSEWTNVADILEEAADAETGEAAAQALSKLMDLEMYADNEQLLVGLGDIAMDEKLLETGEGKYVNVGGNLIVAGYDTVEKVDPNTGETYEAEELDPTTLPQGVIDQMQQQGITADDMVTVLVPGARGPLRVEAIPEKVQYGAATFLLGTNSGPSDAELDEWDIPNEVKEAIDQSRPLTSEEIQSLSRAQREKLIGSGALQEAPFTPQRIKVGTDVYWLDEGVAGKTPTWHKGSLPYAPKAVGSPDDNLLNPPHFGMSTESARLWPSIDVDETDTDTGTLVPNGGVDEKSYDKEVRAMQEENELPSVVNIRDPRNPDEVIEVPSDNVLLTAFVKPLYKAVAEAKRMMAARDDAIVSTLSEEEAAEVSGWSETEKQEYADSIGWNTQEMEFQPTKVGDDATKNTMSALGIKAPETQEAQSQVTYDPSKVAKEQAYGVRKANKMERDAKRKAALTERDWSAKAASRAPLPKLTPKLPTVKDTSDYGPRIDKTAGYKPPKPDRPEPDTTDPSTYTSPTQITRGF